MIHKYKDFFGSLEEYTEEITVKDHENPALLNLNGEDISVYIGKLGIVTREPDNVRHAPSKKNIGIQRDRYKNGVKVAFMGVYDGEKNYCAWNPQHIFSLKTVTHSSLRAPRLYEKERLSSPVIDERIGYTSIIMPPSALGPYFDNVEAFHSIADNDTVIRALEYGMTYSSEDPPNYDYTESGKKTQLVFRGTLRKSRDEKFRRDVMHAYDSACCICGLQFATEAAHIIPHRNEDTHQIVQNGLALCPNHHKMYDKELLTIDSEYRILINHDAISELRSEGLSGGLDEVEKLDGKQMWLPRDREVWPSVEYLESHNKNRSNN